MEVFICSLRPSEAIFLERRFGAEISPEPQCVIVFYAVSQNRWLAA
jgi:hypothetical protein